MSHWTAAHEGKPDSHTKETKVYYCERCLRVHGHLTKMIYIKHDPEDEDSEPEGFWCRRCQSHWRLNRGQARHHVSLQLQLYRALAKELGVPENDAPDEAVAEDVAALVETHELEMQLLKAAVDRLLTSQVPGICPKCSATPEARCGILWCSDCQHGWDPRSGEWDWRPDDEVS